jgi:hypothetical protein
MSRTANINPAAYLIALEDNPSGALLAASGRDILLRIPDVCTLSDKDWVGLAENGRLLSAVRTERDRRITRRPQKQGRKR